MATTEYWAQISLAIPFYIEIEAESVDEAGRKLQEMLDDPVFKLAAMEKVAEMAATGDQRNVTSFDGVLMKMDFNEED